MQCVAQYLCGRSPYHYMKPWSQSDPAFPEALISKISCMLGLRLGFSSSSLLLWRPKLCIQEKSTSWSHRTCPSWQLHFVAERSMAKQCAVWRSVSFYLSKCFCHPVSSGESPGSKSFTTVFFLSILSKAILQVLSLLTLTFQRERGGRRQREC